MQKCVPLFGATSVYNEEGRAFNTATSGQTYRYEYVLRDHLGNTRLVFTDKNGNGSIDNTEILSETHYYPFGKTFEGAWYNDASASKYKYLYNGKEVSDEFRLNFYDYGARWLDPGMGSWWEIDPKAESFSSLSPYNYADNNPVNTIDPDGMSGQHIATTYVTPAGETILDTDDGRKDVYVVPWSQLAEFQANVQYTSKGMSNSIGWNNYWRDRFELLLPGSLINSLHASKSGISSLIKYALNGSFADFLSFELSEIAGQWQDPELVIGSLSAGLSAQNVIKNVIKQWKKPIILEGAVKSNYARFVGKVPANSKSSASFTLLDDGTYLFEATSSGKVPGSKAIYQKWVDSKGETVKMLKTTVDPSGNIVHIKPK